MRKIGIRINNRTVSILQLENNKVKLPEWIEEVERVLYLELIDSDNIEENLDYYINNAKPMSLVNEFIHDRNTYDYKYILNKGYLHSNITSGYIVLVYNSLPIDENGDPLIDDEINLIEAIVWYNVMQYAWQATIRNPQQFSFLYNEANKQWSYYSIKAGNAAIFPKNVDELRGLVNKYTSLLPNLKI